MKNILAICTSPDRGGLELYFVSFVNFFSQYNSIFTVCSSNSFISSKISSPLFYLRKNKIIYVLIKIKSLLNFIKENNIDLIHVSWTKDLFLAVLLKKLSRRNIKIIYYRQMKITRRKHDIYHKFIYMNIDLVMTITNNLRKECLECLPVSSDKIKILKYGIKESDKTADKSKIYHKLSIDENKFTIGVFSRIEEQKGQHLVVEALNLLYNKNIQLLIVGHCMDEDYKKNLIAAINRYKLDQKIFFVPFVDNPRDIMEVIDLVVLPTYEETFGLVVAESMMCSTPVIGSNSGGVPEIINDNVNGLLFKSRSSSSLAEKIYSIVESKELSDMLIKNAEVFIRKEYDYDKHFINFKNILKEHI